MGSLAWLTAALIMGQALGEVPLGRLDATRNWSSIFSPAEKTPADGRAHSGSGVPATGSAWKRSKSANIRPRILAGAACRRFLYHCVTQNAVAVFPERTRDGRGRPPPPSGPGREAFASQLLERNGELLRLRVQVPELPGTGDRRIDEVPDQEPLRHVRFVDPTVVPVGRPVAAALDRGGIVQVDERRQSA